MVRISITISDTVNMMLKELCVQKDTSSSEVIRQAVREYYMKHSTPKVDISMTKEV